MGMRPSGTLETVPARRHRRNAQPSQLPGTPGPANVVGRILVLIVTLVAGVIGALVVAAIVAMVLLVAVFDFGDVAGPTECPDSDVPMLRAAYAGDIAEVERRIDAGERGATDDDGRTALYCAARGGQAEVVRRLTAAGADPDVRNAAGDTPLLWAAQQGDIEVIDALLETGADVDLGTNAGQTPLLRAVYAGDAEVVDHLLAAGADPNLGGGADSMVSQLAVLMVTSGAPLEPGSPTGAGAPVASGPNSAGPNPVSIDQITGTPADNITPLHVAAAQRNHEIMGALLRAGADPEAAALGEYTALHVSAFVGDPDGATLLLFGGADPAPDGLADPAVLARQFNHPDVATIIEISAQAQLAAT